MRGRRGAVLVALLTAAAALAGCAGSPAATSTTGGATGAGVPSSPVATPESTGDAGEPREPTCETIISSSTVEEFTALGWTVQEEPFVIGGTQLADGLQCTWGDYSVASDHVLLFGWATITDEQATTARTALLADGWSEIEDEGGLFLTESPDTAAAVDDEGYGLTYQLGDGWVKLADTKQGLLLVEWPPD